MAAARFLIGSGTSLAHPSVRQLQLSDLSGALRKGTDDFLAMPTHALFLCVVYPVIGLLAARLAFGYTILPLLYPMASGFALIAPVAALGLYELSRQREAGLDISVMNVFRIMQSSSISAIIALGVLLILIFIVWISIANAIYVADFGYAPLPSVEMFAHNIFTTSAGWNLIIVGNGVGLFFAILVFSVSVMAFPLLLDRDVGAVVAVATSIRVVVKNPVVMASWGLIISFLLAVGSLPCFLGLPVILPILGHSSWHLYRAAVAPGRAHRPSYPKAPSQRRYAADFPVSLFPWTK
jgi:uncharacterized membrane protein